MALEYLLGGVFIAAIGSVVGFWWYRYPRQSRVVAVEAGLLLGTLAFTGVLMERLTADGPPWLFTLGTAAYLAVWLGLGMPAFSRRFERRTRQFRQPADAGPPASPRADSGRD